MIGNLKGYVFPALGKGEGAQMACIHLLLCIPVLKAKGSRGTKDTNMSIVI